MSENNPLKSDYEPVIWSNNGVDGKVRIIDPNPLAQIVPHEDLFIYVSLKANQRSKTLLTQSDNNGGIKIENFIRNTIDLTVPQQTTEMVDGSKLFSNVAALSTQWTEIGGSPFKENDLGKDFEGFGITNIDIEVKSQTNPKVVIDFIDVRGATLMEQGSCSPYGLFFNLPYPVFTLTLKGYYGRPATYYLNLVKFNSKFNSDTGNIECRGEFIGWTFGFLSDVMVSYASAAQYLDEGLYRPQAILKQKYEDTWNYYIDSGFIPNGTPNPFCNVQNADGTTRCKTIKDFLTDNDLLSKNTLPDIKGSTEFTELDNIIKLKDLNQQYLNHLNDLERKMREALGDTNPTRSSTTGNRTYDLKFSIPNITENNVNTQLVDKVKTLLSTYFDKTKGLLPITIKTIKGLVIKDNIKGFDIINGYQDSLLTNATNEQLSETEGSKLIYNVLEKKFKDKFQNGLLDSAYPQGGINNGTLYWIDLGLIKESIENDMDAIDKEIDGRRNTVIESINEKITTVVGFKPSIRNIFTVILCNCDAFMEILKSVSVRGEQDHIDNPPPKDNEKILSGPNYKVFSWPTYMKIKPNGSSGGNAKKEVYPGEDFPLWPEVKFVEDFINAFLEFKKDIDILNDDKQGRPGFDNYAPINPLETPLNYDDYFLSYKDVQNNAEIGNGTGFWKLIGERLIISLDHSYSQPARILSDSTGIYYPGIGTISTTPLIETPLSPTEYGTINETFIRKLAQIDANNLINTIEKFEVAYAVTTQDESEDSFRTKIIDELKKNGDLQEITVPVPVNRKFYAYKPTEDGIRLNGKGVLGGDPIIIKPNPHEMDVKDLFKILTEEDARSARPIEIKSDLFKTKMDDYGKIISEKIPSSFDPDWEFIDSKSQQGTVNTAKIDGDTYKQQTPSFFTDRLFITLDPLNSESGFFSVGADASSWFTSDDSKQIPPSSMSNWLAFDYGDVGYDQGDIDDTGAIHLSNFIDFNDANRFGKTDVGFLSPAAAASPLVMTPLWLDNVNRFRKATKKPTPELRYTPINTMWGTSYNSDDVQNRNLAYLYLQSLKPTPLIIRETDDDMDMIGKAGMVNPYSIKVFNSAAGIVRAPKAWVLAMGAIFWRWKCFVGKNSNGKWNNPLNGEIPNGFDPLSQPGFNTLDPNDIRTDVPRNQIVNYLRNIYDTTALGTNNVQISVFRSEGYTDREDALAKNENESFWNSRFAFDYYQIYQNDISLVEGSNPPKRIEDKTNLGSNVYLSGQNRFGFTSISSTAEEWSNSYGWPQLWIAPHHIPYIHPIAICANSGADDDENDAAYFTILTERSAPMIDYQTMMPITRLGNTITDELSSYGRSLTKDSNLGYIMMNLPDQVKEEFVRVFEDWVVNEWVEDILPIVDTANFNLSNKMVDNYMVKKEKDEPKINLPTQDALFELKDDRTSVRDKLLGEKYVIINSTPKMWLGMGESIFSSSNKNYFLIDKEMFDSYLNAFKIEYNEILPKRVEELNKEQADKGGSEAIGQTLLEDDDVKLSLYRTFKSMADKWLSTDANGKTFFNVTEGSGDSYCNKSSGIETVGKNGKSTLATHFQYVSRTMVDIGDDAVIDITKLNELKDNLKISLYQYLSDVLTENNYLFFPLPSYINFGTNGMKTEDLLDMFRPTMSMKDVSCGPLFLSMYVGGNSRVLNINNFGAKVNCPIDFNALSDDGFDLSTGRNTPDEFRQPGNADPGVTAFRIVYGLENQNHFKNIQLDQAEFSETGESLLVIDKLSKQGGSDQTSKGQNLHNVYLTRSYTCQVESFGNVMIQPMTYFDLFGVPMFNGTYLITEVRHNFKPNHATTTFKGVRQPIATVPIITDAALAMNLSLKEIKASENKKSIKDASTGGRTSNGTTKTGGRTSNGTTKTGGGSGDYAPVLSAYDGVVMVTGAAGGYGAPPNGGWIIVRYGLNGGDSPFSDGNYYYYVYGHCNAAEGIVKNTKVKKGQVIGSAVFPNYDINGNKEFNGGLHLHLIVVKTKDSKWAGGGGRDYIAKIDPQLVLNLGADKSIKGVNDFPASADKYKSAKNPNGDTSISPDGYNLRPSIAPELKDFGNPVSSENLPRISSYMYRKDPVKGTYYHGGLDIGFTSPTKGSGVEGSDNAQDDSLASSNQRCKTSYPKLPWTEHKRTLLTYRDAKKYLSKATDEATAKSVFAILWAEACHTSNKNCGATPEEKATPAFISSGNYNYAGVQSDGNWGDKERTGTENRYPFFSSQYCRKDSGNQYRAFASFENNEKFLDFMIDRIKAKGFNSSTPDGWTTTYVQKWWSPGLEDKNGGVAAKTKIYKDSTKTWADFHDTVKIGGETYDNKKSIFNTAINRWDNLA